MKSGAAAVNGLWGQVQKLGGQLGNIAIVGGFAHMIESAIDAGHELIVTSEQIGLSADALLSWRKVAAVAGVEADEMSTSLRFLQRNAYAAANGGAEQTAAFAKLHVTVKNADGSLKDANTLMYELAAGMSETSSETERVALAQTLLGRSGSRLLPILTQGDKGIEKMRNSLEELGVGFSADGARKAEEAHKSFTILGLVWGSLKARLVNQVIPSVTQATEKFTQMLGWVSRITKGTNVFQAALIVLGAVAGVAAFNILWAFAPIILSMAVTAAEIAAVILVVDDLLALFRGGRSIIGDWIDDMYGVGESAKFVSWVKEEWDSLVGVLKDGKLWLDENKDSVDFLADGFRDLGTDMAFVIDQFKFLIKHWGEFTGGVGSLLSGGAANVEHRGGADGFGETVTHTDKQGNTVSGDRAPGGFFGGLSRMAGDAKSQDPISAGASGAINLPEVTVSAQRPNVTVKNDVHLHVDANAAPTPGLLGKMRQVAGDVLDEHSRKMVAQVQGGNG